MTTDSSGTSPGLSVGARTATTLNLKTLKTPAEGGTKKEYEDFLDTIQTHVSINWEFGQDVAYVMKNTELPIFIEPIDLSKDEEYPKESGLFPTRDHIKDESRKESLELKDPQTINRETLEYSKDNSGDPIKNTEDDGNENEIRDDGIGVSFRFLVVSSTHDDRKMSAKSATFMSTHDTNTMDNNLPTPKLEDSTCPVELNQHGFESERFLINK